MACADFGESVVDCMDTTNRSGKLYHRVFKYSTQHKKCDNYDDARLVKPAGEGPFPLIVLTHGTPRSAEERKNTDVINYYKAQTEYFVDKGYAVLFVVRRGFGASTASYAENLTLSNGEKDYWRAGLEAAKDLKAAIDYAKSRQDIEKNQIVLVGQSTGGHSVIATGSLNIEGIRGNYQFCWRQRFLCSRFSQR